MISLIKAETKIAKVIYATVVIVASLAFPLYLIPGFDVFSFEVNIKTVSLVVAYFIVVVGFVFLIFNKKGVNLTTKETDENITNKFQIMYQVLAKLGIPISLVIIIWSAYTLWKLKY